MRNITLWGYSRMIKSILERVELKCFMSTKLTVMPAGWNITVDQKTVLERYHEFHPDLLAIVR